MTDKSKTKKQLISELEELRLRVGELEKSDKERKKLEKRLHESEAELAAVMDSAPVVMFIVDRDYQVRKVNGALVTYSNLSDGETVGLRSGDLLRCFNSLDSPEGCGYGPRCQECNLRCYVEDTLKTGNIHLQIETAIPVIQGESKEDRYFLVSTAPVNVKRSRQVLVSLEDITVRRKIEKELRTSEERYRLLADNVFDVIWTMDIEFNLTYVSPSDIKLRGNKPEETLQQSLADILTPSSLEVAKDVLGEGVKWILSGTGDLSKMRNVELEMNRKDGSTVWTETTADILFSQDGVAMGFIGISRDISRRKQAEEKSKKLLNDMHDGYGVIKDGKYIFVNRKFSEILGYKPQQVVGKPFDSFFLPESRQAILKIFERVISSGEAPPDQHEATMVKRDGTEVIVEASIGSMDYEGDPAFSVIVRDITARRQVEENYRQLLEDMNDGYGVVQDGKYVFANRRFAEIFGLDLKQVIGQSVTDFMISEERRNAIESYGRVLRGEQEYARSWEGKAIRNTDGKIINIESSIRQIQYEGKPAYSVINRDITGRKQIEEKYRHLLEDMNDGYLVVQDGKYVFANRRFAEMTGYNLKQLIGMPMQHFIMAEYYEMITNLYEKMERGEKVYAEISDVKLTKADGTEMIAEASVKAIQYEDKPAFYAVIRDITESKRMEKAVRESEEKLRHIFESVPEGIVITDFEGNILDMNSSAVRMHGYDCKEELIGRKGVDLMMEKDHSWAAEGRKKMLLEGEGPGFIRSHFERKDGSIFPAMMCPSLLRDTAGQPSGVVTIIADITEEQKMQEQLMLTDRLASIGQLAAGIAHEVNNPLTGVIGISQLLLDKDLPEYIEEDLRIIDKEAQRAANVVRGLLIFVRNERAGKLQEDINKIIQEVLQMRSYEQKVNNIAVDARFASNLPQLTINAAQMQQVFMNLVINAEQAIMEVNKRGRLEVTTEEIGDVVRLSIKDDGPGISEENMKRLFTPFFTTKDVGKGTGLGLSICHGIVREHGGRLYAESEPGKGAAFIIELPVIDGYDKTGEDSLISGV